MMDYGPANPRLKADGATAARFRRSGLCRVVVMAWSLALAAPQLSRNVGRPGEATSFFAL
jgi:hypothetical protein